MQSPDIYLLYHNKDLLWASWIEYLFCANGYFVHTSNFSLGHIHNIPDWVADHASDQSVAVIIEAEEMYASGTLAEEWNGKVRDSPVLRQTVMLRRKNFSEPALQATYNKELIGAEKPDMVTALKEILGRLNFQLFNRKLAMEQNTLDEPIYPGLLPRNWLMPYAPMSVFIGHDAEQDALSNHLGETHAFSIYANMDGRGHGLSSLTVRSIYRYLKEFSTVWWIMADDSTLMLADLKELGRRFGVVSSGSTLAEVWPVVSMAMKSTVTRPFIVVLDHPNAEVMADFETLAKNSWDSGSLLTVGAKPKLPSTQTIEVTELERKDAIWLLGLGATDMDESAEKVGPMESLATWMKFNPLLLRMVSKLIKNGQKIDRFIEDFNLEGQIIQSPTIALKPSMINTRFVLDQLTNQNPDAAQLLMFSAYFAARPIPKCIFEPSPVKHSLSDLFQDHARFQATIKLLNEYGVIHRSNESFFMHISIAQGIMLMSDYHKDWQQTIIRLMSEKLSAKLPETLLEERRRDIYPHALNLCLDLVRKKKINADATVLINNIANQARSYQNPVLAAELLQGLMGFFTSSQGEQSAEVSSLAANLGVTYNMQGKTDEALAMFQKALEIDKKLYGENHVNIGDDLAQMARLYESKRDYARAASEYEKAKTIFIDRLGDGHIKLARLLSNFSNTLKALGKLDIIFDYAQQIVAIEAQHYGEHSPRLCGSLVKLGLISANIGDYDLALSSLERALDIETKVYGIDHPKVALRLSHLGNIHEKTGNNARAAEYYRKAVAIFTDTIGATHPSCKAVVDSLNRVS